VSSPGVLTRRLCRVSRRDCVVSIASCDRQVSVAVAPRQECLKPSFAQCFTREASFLGTLTFDSNAAIVPGTARVAISVSLFQHPGGFFPPLPLKWRGFQKEGIGEITITVAVGSFRNGQLAGDSVSGQNQRFTGQDESPRLVPWHCCPDPSCIRVIRLDRHEVKGDSKGKQPLAVAEVELEDEPRNES